MQKKFHKGNVIQMCCIYDVVKS